jgi:TolB protein
MESSLDRIHAQSGHTEKLLPGGTLNVHPGWSSDARQMVVALSTDSGDELFIMSADGESLNQISSDLPLPRLRMPRWSPDGEWIAFWGGQPSEWKLWRVRSDGGDLQPLSQPIESLTNLQWSPNGKWLLFSADHDRQPTIFRLRADGSSMENLGLGENPQFAPIAGLRWRPFWLMTVALGMFLVTLVSRRGFETRFYAGKRL